MKDKTRDMTEGNPLWLIVSFAIPMLIGNVFQQLYNLVDSVIVGKLVGAEALAAIGATSSVTFLFFALCNGIGSGGGIITSQYFGKKDYDGVKSCIANTGYIMFVFPAILGVVSFLLAGHLLRLMSTPESIFHDSLVYMRVMCLGLVFVSIYNYVASMLRALGDSRTPLYFLVFSCVLNVILDILFVKYLNLATFGAAIATLIAQFISGICCFFYAFKTNPLFQLERKDLVINKDVIKDTVGLGIPLSLQFSMIAISNMALQKAVNAFGAIAVAAFTTTARVEMIMHQPYSSVGMALSTYVGQNYGAGKKERLVTGYRKSMWLMVAFTTAMIPVMQFFGKQITAFFVTDPEVILMGARSLQITSYFYYFLGVIYIIRGMLNGVGDAFFAMFNGGIEVIFRSSLPFLFVLLPGLGVWGIWWAVGVVWALSGSTAWLRYIWYKKKLDF